MQGIREFGNIAGHSDRFQASLVSATSPGVADCAESVLFY